MLNVTNITPPRVPVIDERTGLISREWYRFFLNLFSVTYETANTAVAYLSSAPAPTDYTVVIDSKVQDVQLAPPIQFGTLAYQNSENAFVTRLSTVSPTTGARNGFISEDSGFLTLDGVNGVVTAFNGSPRTVTQNTGFRPHADNAYDLGTAPQRWKEVYAAVGTINTSDATEKQQVRTLQDAELRVAQRIKSLIRAFKWNSAVDAKGDDARIHIGVMAQDVRAAFEAEGLDAHKYGMFCSDDIPDADGTTRPRLGVRYDQLLAFVIAAM